MWILPYDKSVFSVSLISFTLFFVLEYSTQLYRADSSWAQRVAYLFGKSIEIKEAYIA